MKTEETNQATNQQERNETKELQPQKRPISRPRQKDGFREVTSKISNSLFVKLLMIIFLILLLMIPSSMIESLVKERDNRKVQVIEEISGKWGSSQTISGPVLTIPYKHHTVSYSYQDKNRVKNIETEIRTATFLPHQFNVNGELQPEQRCRGIYQALLYTAKVKLDGYFEYPDFSQWNIDSNDIIWDDAYISLGISDLSGIRGNIDITFNSEQFSAESGTEKVVLIKSGVHAKTPIKALKDDSSIPFTIDLTLNGSTRFDITPIGKTTDIALTSTWHSPSFSGAILPNNREISEDGFNANWQITHLNRSVPQQWLEDKDYFSSEYGSSYNGKGGHRTYNSSNSSTIDVGVTMVLPVDDYHKVKRTVDYATLFTLLTFVMFFVFELIIKIKVHPFQYLLIGTALTLFYSLLLSISEHSHFLVSYITASVAITAMIGFYTKSIVKKYSLALAVGGFISALYLYLYTVLQQEQFSLLIGSIGLFVMLAMVMYLTRNINWYEPKEK